MLRFQFLSLCFASFFCSTLHAQNFYNRDTIQVIEIFFSFTNWDAQLDANEATETYIYADSVRINGVSFDSCGIRYKGNSSYSPNNQKNPLRIELNTIKVNQDYHGIKDIKLSNCYKDPSMIREILSYQILEQYMDCPSSNFARVYINGQYRGVYTNNESISDDFNEVHYHADDTYFKCNPVGGAGPGSTVSPDLKYLGADSSAYFNGYELQTTFGWNRMVALCNALNNDFQNIEGMLDIDRAIWMLAFNNVLVNLDSYSGAFRQNYYLSWDINGRFVPTVWDVNMSFGGFPGGTGSGTTTPTSLDPFSNATSNNHPLIKQIMANPLYKRMYMAHVRTMVQEMFASGQYETWAQNLMALADSSIQADTYKFYTYTQFLNSLTTAVTGGGPGGGGSIPGIKALMDARAQFFSTNAAYVLQAPSIVSHGASTSPLVYGSTVTITATTANETTVYLGYRGNHQLKFTRVQMFDDGAHNDGAAGDHIFGIEVPVGGLTFEYYIYAENNNAGLFSPARAEHEFHTLAVNFPTPAVGTVLINEVLASNDSLFFDPNGQDEDWIELINTTNTPIDLAGFYLSDDPLNLLAWAFPAGTILPANGYLLVWADNDLTQTGLHANFKLSAGGDYVYLSHGFNVHDQISFGPQLANISYARCPDAGLNFATVIPTPLANNNCQIGIQENEQLQVQVYPNPFVDQIIIDNQEENMMLQIHDINGRILRNQMLQNGKNQIDTSTWSSGVYLVKVQVGAKMQTWKLVK
jgi:CotH kinase protein/Lamin Tail Domain/Secretion system C-terminal sorting domain